MLALLVLPTGHLLREGAHAALAAPHNATECGGDVFCSGNGQCWRGECRCSRGFEGPVCGSIVGCPNECLGDPVTRPSVPIRGTCKRAGLDGAKRVCFCTAGWTGHACERKRCPDDCSGRGRCVDGACQCIDGYSGPSCSEGRCEPGCVHGDCGADFACICGAGWTGVACDKPLPCWAPEAPPPATSSARRLAAEAASPPRREARLSIAPKPCGEHGVCRDGLCFCDAPWFGLQCERQQCTDDKCGGHGQCVDGSCVCEAGWLVPDCAARRCPGDCSGTGYCMASGVCSCKPGFGGADCTEVSVVEQQSARGGDGAKPPCDVGLKPPAPPAPPRPPRPPGVWHVAHDGVLDGPHRPCEGSTECDEGLS